MSRAQQIADRVDAAAHAKRLSKAMTPHYITLLELGWDAKIGGAFDVSNPAVKQTISRLATRCVGMTETTKDDIRAVLERAFDLEDVPGVDKIAAQLREAGVTSSRSRSRTIARTETRAAYNEGAIMSYREAGVERVEILDSDNDPECAERNGKIVSIEEATEIDPHPNCVIAFAPVVGRGGD